MGRAPPDGIPGKERLDMVMPFRQLLISLEANNPPAPLLHGGGTRVQCHSSHSMKRVYKSRKVTSKNWNKRLLCAKPKETRAPQCPMRTSIPRGTNWEILYEHLVYLRLWFKISPMQVLDQPHHTEQRQSWPEVCRHTKRVELKPLSRK